MILGTGIDIVKTSRFQLAFDRWGEKFLEKIFTESEISFSFKQRNPFPSLSARFAGKEAFSKALGTGFSSGIKMKDIEIVREAGKGPDIKLHGHTLATANGKGVQKIHLSLSHESEYSVASVILTGRETPSQDPSPISNSSPTK